MCGGRRERATERQRERDRQTDRDRDTEDKINVLTVSRRYEILRRFSRGDERRRKCVPFLYCANDETLLINVKDLTFAALKAK